MNSAKYSIIDEAKLRAEIVIPWSLYGFQTRDPPARTMHVSTCTVAGPVEGRVKCTTPVLLILVLMIIRSVVKKQMPTHHSRFLGSGGRCGSMKWGSWCCSSCPASGVSTDHGSDLEFRGIPGCHFGGGRRSTYWRTIYKKRTKTNLILTKDMFVQTCLLLREFKSDYMIKAVRKYSQGSRSSVFHIPIKWKAETGSCN
jgi:hypothetical protein